MDIDEDFDASLLRNFSCLGTNDKEVLIKQLQALIGINLTQQAACFYLDMSNWNVQAAVCAYFDMEASARLPKMCLVRDDTVGEGESVQPLTQFQKSWCIRNEGLEWWPSDCHMVLTSGHRLGAPETLVVPSLAPGETKTISMVMMSPEQPGTYSSSWRFSTSDGAYFGDVIWVILHVEQSGTLALLQKMESLRDFGTEPRGDRTPPSNPFSVVTLSDSLASQHFDSTNNNTNADADMS